MKLPVGIQSFKKIRTDNFLYVDKKENVYQLAHNNVPYFLSRPRRFGKSLLLSTLKAYWEGRKDLFEGLKITELEKDDPEAWQEYPVFYFDFNGVDYQIKGNLEKKLGSLLSDWEEQFKVEKNVSEEEGSGETLPGDRFRRVLVEAYNQTGKSSVVLVDEYDKPLLDVIDDPELHEHNRNVFKGFFSVLKSCDEYLRFVLITGVLKFHKVSIFSDLNQLRDISLSKEYAGICGISEEELKQYFRDDIEKLSQAQGITDDKAIEKLKRTYDGYHFHPVGEAVYNPYSLLNCFADGEFRSYWFSTGTPSFLMKKLRETRFDPRRFTAGDIYASESVLSDYTGDSLDAVPLLYQTGYLTIIDYDQESGEYTLGFPNDEVKYGFTESLIHEYISDYGPGRGTDIFTLRRYVDKGDTDGIRRVLTALFAGITYTRDDDPFEHYFQSVIYVVFTLLGKFVQTEMHTFSGRIDCKVETGDYIYLFEFKRDDTVEAALAQIDSKEYALPFVADDRKLIKIGVSFDSESRQLVGWQVA